MSYTTRKGTAYKQYKDLIEWLKKGDIEDENPTETSSFIEEGG